MIKRFLKSVFALHRITVKNSKISKVVEKESNPPKFDYINYCSQSNDYLFQRTQNLQDSEKKKEFEDEKLAKLKSAIKNGNYVIDSERIASKIIKHVKGS